MRANIAIAITRMVVKPNRTSTSDNDDDELFPANSPFCEEKLLDRVDDIRAIPALRATTITEHFHQYSVSTFYVIIDEKPAKNAVTT